MLIFEGLIEQSSKFDIGVNSKVFFAEKTKTAASEANEITETENLTSRLMSLDRHYLDLSEKECTYVVLYLSFGQCGIYTSSDKFTLVKIVIIKIRK